MADTHNKETRSYNMSRIRGKNTKPELIVRQFLFAMGFRYKIHDKTLPGKPDLVFPKYKTVLFVHGCFWHNHSNCKLAVLPKSNEGYWFPKIMKNAIRDYNHQAMLEKMGWHVIVIWECDLKKTVREKTLKYLAEDIKLNLTPL